MLWSWFQDKTRTSEGMLPSLALSPGNRNPAWFWKEDMSLGNSFGESKWGLKTQQERNVQKGGMTPPPLTGCKVPPLHCSDWASCLILNCDYQNLPLDSLFWMWVFTTQQSGAVLSSLRDQTRSRHSAIISPIKIRHLDFAGFIKTRLHQNIVMFFS